MKYSKENETIAVSNPASNTGGIVLEDSDLIQCARMCAQLLICFIVDYQSDTNWDVKKCSFRPGPEVLPALTDARLMVVSSF